MNRGLFGFACLCVIMLASCVPEGLVWTASHAFGNQEWNEEEKISFFPDSLRIETARGKGTLKLVARYEAKTNVESMPLVIETENPLSGSYSCDTVIMNLLSFKERVAGNGKLGIFESELTLAENERMNPGWNITLYPLVNVKGIYTLTLEIEKSKNKNEK